MFSVGDDEKQVNVLLCSSISNSRRAGRKARVSSRRTGFIGDLRTMPVGRGLIAVSVSLNRTEL